MARRSKPGRAERPANRQRQLQRDLAGVVQEMASRYSCTSDVACAFVERCDQRIERLAFDLRCTGLAIAMWDPIESEEARRVVGLLSALLEEDRRHHVALLRLTGELAAHAQRDVHEHLEPVSRCEEIIWKCLFETPAEPNDKVVVE